MWEIETIVRSKPYLRAKIPTHPNANSCGYIQLHRALMENSLGRLLEPYEVVHHKDGNTLNNEIENLELTTFPFHPKIHAKGETKINLICANCGKKFSREVRNVRFKMLNGQKDFYCNRSCMAKHFGRGRTKDRASLSQ